MIYVTGIGPGKQSMMTGQALFAIEQSDVIVGYKTYIALIEPLLAGKQVVCNGMRQEIDRCREAVRLSKEGHTVCVVSSGDAGVYGMAGLVLELVQDDPTVEVIIVPGVTASLAAAALLGAPIMHDFCHISLSDLLTPLQRIYQRVDLAAQGDFVICFYNPRSQGRPDYLQKALDIIGKWQSPDTPVGIVTDAGRAQERLELGTLGSIDLQGVGMTSLVIVGNSQTYLQGDKMITPRGYQL